MSKEIVTTKTTVKKPRTRRTRKNKKNTQARTDVVHSKVVTTSSTLTNHKPVMSVKKDSCRIQHTEPLGVVSVPGPDDFKIVVDLDINPGDEKAFPWLSTTAKAWEYYKIHRLSYHFMSRTSTLTSGEVVMAPDYDINDQVPATIEELTQNEGAVSSNAFKDFHCEFKKLDLMGNDRRKLVRGFVPRANFDQGRYDVGSFYVAVSGIVPNPASYPVTIGRLYVRYDIEFFVPVGNRTEPPLEAPVLSFSNAPSLSTQTLPSESTTISRPTNTIYDGLKGVIEENLAVPGTFTVQEDAILKVTGLDQFISIGDGDHKVTHAFRKIKPDGSITQLGGSTSIKKGAKAQDQFDSTFDFLSKFEKGDILKHSYNNEALAAGLGGYSSLNIANIGRNFIPNSIF